MSSQIGTRERANDDEPQVFVVRRAKRGLDQPVAEVSSSQFGRDLGVHDAERLACAFVREKRDTPVGGELEPALSGVVDDVSVH